MFLTIVYPPDRKVRPPIVLATHYDFVPAHQIWITEEGKTPWSSTDSLREHCLYIVTLFDVFRVLKHKDAIVCAYNLWLDQMLNNLLLLQYRSNTPRSKLRSHRLAYQPLYLVNQKG